MGGRTRTIIITIALLALIAIGFLFVRGPIAHIQLPAEKITNIGPFPLTNTIVATWVTMLILIGLSWAGTRNQSLVPRRLQCLLEMVVEAMLNLCVNAAGQRNGRRFFPVVASIFFFVLINNWTGLLPGYGTIGLVEVESHGYEFDVSQVGPLKVALLPIGQTAMVESHGDVHDEHAPAAPANKAVGLLVPFFRSASTDLNTPLALALMSAIFVEYWGIATLGLLRYGTKFFNFGALLRLDLFNGIIDVFVGILELISEFARIISFTFRLFGNIFAGEVLLAVMGFLMPFVVLDVFYGLELFVGFIQALIFALLTLVFGIIAVTPAHGGGEHEAEAHGHH